MTNVSIFAEGPCEKHVLEGQLSHTQLSSPCHPPASQHFMPQKSSTLTGTVVMTISNKSSAKSHKKPISAVKSLLFSLMTKQQMCETESYT